ncbi:MAG: hypothetical protein H6719_35510 [Sandaracinaceae bacterium]|nr:hypothetical protein [Sandaracinaceae bacterium]
MTKRGWLGVLVVLGVGCAAPPEELVEAMGPLTIEQLDAERFAGTYTAPEGELSFEALHVGRDHATVTIRLARERYDADVDHLPSSSSSTATATPSSRPSTRSSSRALRSFAAELGDDEFPGAPHMQHVGASAFLGDALPIYVPDRHEDRLRLPRC